jgi:hypothetical protein
MRPVSSFLSIVAGILMLANTASAAVIDFSLTDFLRSTQETSGVNLSPDPSSAPALPADATFTVLVPSAPIPLSENQGLFLRFNFVLPSGFSDLAFSFNSSVDDEYALYLTDTVVAIQSDTATESFTAPFPGLTMASDGSISSTKLEYVNSSLQSLFQVGANELTLFGTDALISGNIFSADGSITFDVQQNGVPEPSILLLLGTAFAAFGFTRRRRKA